MSRGAAKRVGEAQEAHKPPQPWEGPSEYERRLWERVAAGKEVCYCCDERADRVIKVEGQPVPTTWVCYDYDSPRG